MNRTTTTGPANLYFCRSKVDDLKFRVNPSSDSDLMAWSHFDKGNPLLAICTDQTGDWTLVHFHYGDGKYESQVGWVWTDYLEAN